MKVKTSKHTVRFAHHSKQIKLDAFLTEYRRVAELLLDYMWNNPVKWNNKTLDIPNGKYDCPSFISTVNLNIDTPLSARALKCCSTQVCGIIKAVIEKPRRRAWRLNKLKAEGKPYSNLIKAIARQIITKPIISNIKAELNSICCDYHPTVESHFNGFLQLKSIGKKYGRIRIPIKHHRHSNKLKSKSTRLLNSFLITNTAIDFRWELPKTKLKQTGTTLGVDQGMKSVLTFSNSTVTKKHDIHGHSLESIMRRLARKRRGSKAFAQTQQHRINHINWTINQLNFSNIKELRLEAVENIKYRRKTSRLMTHWSNPLIRDKLQARCEEEQVALTFVPSAYRSQRCFTCGWVQKSNRNAQQFRCKACGHKANADINAAQNLTLTLPEITIGFRKQRLNLKGFLWNPNGIKLLGEDFTVPPSQKEK